MEKLIRPSGNGFDEIVFTCTSVSERDAHSKCVPLVVPDTHEMRVEWLTEMSFRIRCVEKPVPAAPVAAPAPAAAAAPAAPGPKSEGESTAPPLPGLLGKDKAALSNAKFEDLQTACVEAGCPVVVDKRPRANIVAEILKWREGRK